MQLSNYLIAYLDLLGQSAELESMPSAPESEADILRIWEVSKANARIILQMRQQLSEFQRLAADRSEERFKQINPEIRDQFAQMASSELFFVGFSDAFIVGCRLTEGHHTKNSVERAKAANSILTILSGMASLSIVSLASGIPLRGGVEIGLGVDVTQTEVYGRLVLDAYRLESREAEYPRILVGANVLMWLKWFSEMDAKDRSIAQFAVRQAKRALDDCVCVAPDDGKPMVHFLSQVLAGLHRGASKPDGGSIFEARHSAENWIRREKERYSNLGNEKLRDRYARLLQYFEQYPWNSDES